MRMKKYIFSLISLSALLFSSCHEEEIAFSKVSRIAQGVDMIGDWCRDFNEVAFDIESCFILNDELSKCTDLPKGEMYINANRTVYIKRMGETSFRAVILEPYTVCLEAEGDLYTQGTKWNLWSTISSNFAEGFIGHVIPSNYFGYGKYYNFPMTFERLDSSWKLTGVKRGETQRSNNIFVERAEIDGRPTLILNGVGQNPLSNSFNYHEYDDIFPAFDYFMDYKMINIKWQKANVREDYRVLSGELFLDVQEYEGINSLTPSAVFNDITVTVSYSGEQKTLHHSEVYY